MKLEEEIYNYRSNIELRTSQLVRLKTEKAARVSATPGDGGSRPMTMQESIFSSNNYGVSTLSQPNFKHTLPDRGTTHGPRVKTKKPYCTLI